MTVVKTFPMNRQMLGTHSVGFFFSTVVPKQQRAKGRLGAFFVIGRRYISQATLPGTLVLFQLEGKIVAHARLQQSWYDETDPAIKNHGAVAIYFFDQSTPLATPMLLKSLPKAWQAKWPRACFDARPRTLDGKFEKQFLRIAKK